MNGQWFLGALLGVAWFVAGLRGVRWAIGRTMRSRAANLDGTWQHDVKREMRANGPRFEASVHYFISAGAIFLCASIAAVLGVVPIWLGLFWFGMAVLSAAAVEARVRYGTGRLTDLGRVLRSWVRPSG